MCSKDFVACLKLGILGIWIFTLPTPGSTLATPGMRKTGYCVQDIQDEPFIPEETNKQPVRKRSLYSQVNKICDF